MVFLWDMHRAAVHRKWSTLVVARLATFRLTILDRFVMICKHLHFQTEYT